MPTYTVVLDVRYYGSSYGTTEDEIAADSEPQAIDKAIAVWREIWPDHTFHPVFSAPAPGRPIDQTHLPRAAFQAFWAIEKGDYELIDVPVLTEITPGLWVGGAPEPKVPSGFDFVVNLFAPWARYDPNGAEVVNVPGIGDDAGEGYSEVFYSLARHANRRVEKGQTVLVHCQAGMNRSATVVVLALMLRGMAARDAIKLLREKRHRLVLCNPHFERWLLELPVTG